MAIEFLKLSLKQGLWALGFAVVALGLLVLAFWPGICPVLIDAYGPPTLSVDNLKHDKGLVAMDSQLHDRFWLTNTGNKPLIISNIETSCGCTSSQLKHSTLAPGQMEPLNVTIDTSLKLGPFTKTLDVYSNDPKHPKTTLTIVAQGFAPKVAGHAAQDMTLTKDRLAMFKGQCRSCHVDKGVGKTGQALFMASCAMCHGMQAQGAKQEGGNALAPSLLEADYESETGRAYVQGVIENGSATNPSMPPFSAKHGGPLSQSQIDSLVTYLRFEAEQKKAAKKAGKLETPSPH